MGCCETLWLHPRQHFSVSEEQENLSEQKWGIRCPFIPPEIATNVVVCPSYIMLIFLSILRVCVVELRHGLHNFISKPTRLRHVIPSKAKQDELEI